MHAQCRQPFGSLSHQALALVRSFGPSIEQQETVEEETSNCDQETDDKLERNSNFVKNKNQMEASR